jgi:hypothetical protein
LQSRLLDLDRRLKKLESRLSILLAERRRLDCICRKVTNYHTARELEAIFSIPCPTHGVMNPGSIFYRTTWLPLDPEHRQFCKCPPNIWREFIEGKRPRPTSAEEAEFSKIHPDPYTQMSPDEGEQAFQEEHRSVEDVINRHRLAVLSSRSTTRLARD